MNKRKRVKQAKTNKQTGKDKDKQILYVREFVNKSK